MHPKRRDNQDRYLRAAQVKGFIKKTADNKGLTKEQVHQRLTTNYKKMFKIEVLTHFW